MKITGEAQGTGTIITFRADETIFTTRIMILTPLSERVREIAYLNKGLEITIHDERTDVEQTFYFEEVSAVMFIT
jgi:DNA gyrase subunit B